MKRTAPRALARRCPPKGPCGRPQAAAFGGPASGLWPSGRTAAVPPSCFVATLFSDCFAGCSGSMNGGSPGPICGWTYNEAFGPLGGGISFTPGIMSLDTTLATDYPGAAKPLGASLPDILGMTVRYSFTEFQGVPTLLTTYQIAVNNVGSAKTVFVSLFGDGSLVVQVGPVAAAPTYNGTWTPNGGSHDVHVTVDALGVPTLFIDGLAIPLTFAGNIFSFASLFPADSVILFAGSDLAVPASSPVTSVFVSSGVLSETMVFCCP